MGLIDLLLPILCQGHHQCKSFKYSDYKSLCKSQKLCDVINYSISLSTLWHAGSDERTSSQYVHLRMELPAVWCSSGSFEHSAFICSWTYPFLHSNFLSAVVPEFCMIMSVCVGRKKHSTLLLAFSFHRILRNQRHTNPGMTWVNIKQILLAWWLLGSLLLNYLVSNNYLLNCLA